METELTGKQSPITPEGVFIIGTYDENGVPNAMNAAWGSQSDYGEITLFLAPKKTVEIVDYFGIETGHKVNKIAKAGCHVHKSEHVNAPIIEEFPYTLECTCKNYDAETGILIGTVVSAQADESILTNGVVDYEKLEPLVFDIATRTYRTIGPVVAPAFKIGLKYK